MENNSSRDLFGNFLWRSLQIFGKQGLILLIFILSAKLLSPYEFGVYNYILAIVFFLIIFGDFGISTATARYVAEYNIKDKKKIGSLLFNSLFLIFLLSLIITLIVLLFGKLILLDQYKYLLYLLPLIFLVPITSLYDGLYKGLKKFKHLAIISIVVGLVSIIFVFVLISKYGLVGALISQNLFYLLLALVLVVSHKEIHLKFEKELVKKIGTYSFLIGVANMGYFLYTRVDAIMLGYFGFINEVAYYELVDKLFRFSILVFSIYGSVILADNVKFFKLKKFQYLNKRIKKTIIFSFLSGMFISLILYLVVPYLIQTFFSQYYSNDFLLIFFVFLFIVPLAVVEAVLAIGYITPLGYVKILTYSTLIGGLLNIVLNFWFLNLFGFIGVILSTVIVHNIINIIKISNFYKKVSLLS